MRARPSVPRAWCAPPRPWRRSTARKRETDAVRWAIEATYEGSLRFEERHLEDPATIRPMTDVLARWVASTLVQLADLPLTFLPPDPLPRH